MRGYLTAMIGKWHLGLRPEVGPRRFGFDFSYGYFHGQIDPYTHRYHGGEQTWHRNDQYVEEKGHVTDLMTDEAVKFIETTAQAAVLSLDRSCDAALSAGRGGQVARRLQGHDQGPVAPPVRRAASRTWMTRSAGS